jgi:predicted MFS family arabinose efflux permease
MGAGVGVTSTLLMALASQKIPTTRMGQGLGYLGLGTTTAMAFGPFIGISLAWELGFWLLFICASSCYLIAFAVSWNIPHINLPQAPPKPEGRRFETVIEPAVLLPAIMMLFFSAAMSSITCYMSILSEEYFLPSAGVFFLLSTLGTFISRLFAGKIFDKKGHPYVFIPAITLHLFAMLSIYSLPQNPLNIITALLNGLGNGALFPAIQTMIITSVPKSKRTIASAYFLVALDLGFGLGAFMMGGIADYFNTFRVAYLVAFWIFIALFIYYLIFYLIPYIRGKRHVLESPKST